MSTITQKTIQLPSYICGRPISTDSQLLVHYPYDNSLVGTVSKLGPDHIDSLIEESLAGGADTTRYDRSAVLNTARELLLERADEFANLIRMETGLCMRETQYEVVVLAMYFNLEPAKHSKTTDKFFRATFLRRARSEKFSRLANHSDWLLRSPLSIIH